MAASSLLERVVAALFGATPGGGHDPDRQLVQDIIEMIVETVEPRVRMHARYREKLQGCVRTTIAWLRSRDRNFLRVLAARSWPLRLDLGF
jgi:hypothetical protein